MGGPRSFHFGEFVFLPETAELYKNGRKLPARAQELLGLEALVENAGRRVSREALTRRIWPETSVGKNNLNVMINRLRALLGDDSAGQRFIKTIGRSGYCFVPRVDAAPDTRSILSADEAAWTVYWRARQLWEARTPKALAESIRLFRRSIALDPSFSLGYAGLADALIMESLHAIRPPSETFLLARGAARRALARRKNLAEAITAEAWVRLCLDRDFSAAEEAFARALALKPGYPFAHNGWSLLMLALDRPAEAVKSMEKAWESDPLSPPLNALLGDTYYYNRQFQKAIEQERKVLEWDRRYVLGHSCMGRSLLQLGRRGDALRHLESACDYSGQSSVMLGLLAHAYARCNRRSAARSALQKLLRRAKAAYVPAYFVALTCLGLGDVEIGLAWLEKAIDERSHWVLFLNVDPVFDDFRSEKGFRRLLHKTFGFSAANAAK
jgi:DNA-binding winged helix-turn-helix (wHTH) protein/Tfp pilus assembly protein PilF